MKEELIRTAMLLGEDGIERLKNSRVAVFGLGGVGGHAAEALARSGVGTLELIDHDRVSLSNLNRQLVADYSTVGEYKTQVMKRRIASVNRDCRVITYESFYLPQEREHFPFESYDYIVDAIDTVTAKLDLAETAERLHIPLISSMGTGNKLDPTKLVVTDIYQTSVCPLARVMRRELKARGVKSLKVVYSTEEARIPLSVGEEAEGRRQIPGSTAFVPAAAGLILAGVVVRELAGI